MQAETKFNYKCINYFKFEYLNRSTVWISWSESCLLSHLRNASHARHTGPQALLLLHAAHTLKFAALLKAGSHAVLLHHTIADALWSPHARMDTVDRHARAHTAQRHCPGYNGHATYTRIGLHGWMAHHHILGHIVLHHGEHAVHGGMMVVGGVESPWSRGSWWGSTTDSA